MYSQALKNIYFGIVRIATYPNFVLKKTLSARSSEPLLVHIGCGTNYLYGFVNVDANLRQKVDMWLDVRNGLPFPDQSVDFLYSCHVLEHFYPEEALGIFREMRRVLKPSGVARIAVPSWEHAIDISCGRAEMYDNRFPRQFDDLSARAINYLFCDGQHKYGYSFGLISEFARQAGWNRVRQCSAADGVTPVSYYGRVIGAEPAGSLVVELSA